MRSSNSRVKCSPAVGAAELAGVHGLIALGVLELFLDVRRQGHLAQALKHLEEYALIVETDYAVAALGDALDLGGELAAAEAQLHAGLGLASGTGQALPASLSQISQEQHFDGAAAFAGAEQPRGQDA